MLRHGLLVVGISLAVIVPSFAPAAEPAGRDPFADAAAPAPAGEAAQRRWLAEQLVAPITNRTRAKLYQEKLDKMSAKEVAALVDKLEQQRESDARLLEQQARAQLQQAAAMQQQLAAQLQQQRLAAQAAQNAAYQPAYPTYYPLYSGGRIIGYAPVVTWLPSGTSMGAGAVVMPGSRNVRTSVTPFFSRVGSGNSRPAKTPTKPIWRGGPLPK